jgi:hypothetical protein
MGTGTGITDRNAGTWEQVQGSRIEMQEHGNRYSDHGKNCRNM